jgi:hypothetical protein
MTGGVFKFHSPIAQNTVHVWPGTPKRYLGGAIPVVGEDGRFFETSPERGGRNFFDLHRMALPAMLRWKFNLILAKSV